MEKIKNYWVENKNLLFLLSTIVITYLIIFSYVEFAIHIDQYVQYNTFYDYFNIKLGELLNQGQLPFYSWEWFLGSDLYSVSFIYGIISIFTPLYYLVNDIGMASFIETILCFYIAGFTMKFFLKEYGIENRNVITFISIVYAFSGSSILFIGYYPFLRFYAFMPLIFLGVERFIIYKRGAFFSISVAIGFFNSYYLMFSTSIFLAVYVIMRLSMIRPGVKKSIDLILHLLFHYICAVCICAFFLIPAINITMSNSRVGSEYIAGNFLDIRLITRYIIDLILPIYHTYESPLTVPNSGYVLNSFSLLTTIFVPICILGSIREKKFFSFYMALILLIAFMSVSFLSSMMHGFSEPSSRWLYIITFFLLHFTASILDSNEFKINFGTLCYSLIIMITVFIIFIIYGTMYKDFYLIIFSSLIINLFIVFVYHYHKNLAFLISIVYLVFGGLNYLIFASDSQSISNQEVTFNRSSLENALYEDDELLYRLYINSDNIYPVGFSSHNKNYPIKYNFMGISSYDSLYDSKLENIKISNNIDFHIFDLIASREFLNLGVKYFLVYDEDELPSGYNFTFHSNVEHLKLYVMDDYKGFSYTFNKFDDISNYEKSDYDVNTLYVELDNKEHNFLPHDRVNLKIYEKSNNHIKGEISLHHDTILYVAIPNNSGWKVRNNGVEVDAIDVNGGFMGIPVVEGHNSIELYFVPRGLKIGIVISFVTGGLILMVKLLRRIKT